MSLHGRRQQAPTFSLDDSTASESSSEHHTSSQDDENSATTKRVAPSLQTINHSLAQSLPDVHNPHQSSDQSNTAFLPTTKNPNITTTTGHHHSPEIHHESSSLPKSSLSHKDLRRAATISQHVRSHSLSFTPHDDNDSLESGNTHRSVAHSESKVASDSESMHPTNLHSEHTSSTRDEAVEHFAPQHAAELSAAAAMPHSTSQARLRRKRKKVDPSPRHHRRSSSGLTNSSSSNSTVMSTSETPSLNVTHHYSTAGRNLSQQHHHFHHQPMTPDSPRTGAGVASPASPSLSITSPQNLIKLKSYIKTLRSQYALLSHHFSLQQEDILLMRKEMSFMEDLLEKRMNRIRQLELEKRIDTEDFWRGTTSDAQIGDSSSADLDATMSASLHTAAIAHSSNSHNKNITEKLKQLDTVLNELYIEKREQKINFVEEDEHISREELISKLKLENQKLKVDNQRLEKENIEWAKQITIKQEELDQLKSGTSHDTSPVGRRQNSMALRPKSMVIKSSNLASMFQPDGDMGTENKAKPVTSFKDEDSAKSLSSLKPPKLTKKVSFSENVTASSQQQSEESDDTPSMSDDTDISDVEENGEDINIGKSYRVIKIDDNVENDASNEVITFSDSDSDDEK
mmetsp:Transcript_9227/g.34114  ORF Transcript_9227/g.34114 Transcript_9227/m.34114 type:complete len:629 (-) Transcript_9227:24-1910(-)